MSTLDIQNLIILITSIVGVISLIGNYIRGEHSRSDLQLDYERAQRERHQLHDTGRAVHLRPVSTLQQPACSTTDRRAAVHSLTHAFPLSPLLGFRQSPGLRFDGGVCARRVAGRPALPDGQAIPTTGNKRARPSGLAV